MRTPNVFRNAAHRVRAAFASILPISASRFLRVIRAGGEIRRNQISRIDHLNRSADWQSAVSRTPLHSVPSGPRRSSERSLVGNPRRPGRFQHPADCQSAIQLVANLRYGRFMERLSSFSLLAASAFLAIFAARADYVGNPIVSGNPDGDPPVAILGEYGNATSMPPGATSTISFPTNGAVNDVQIYNANPGQPFAIFTIRPAGTNANGNQQFTFVNGQTFTAGATAGPETLSPTGAWQVQKGDLIVYWGYVAPYSFGSFNDATYENDGVYTATKPTVGQTYSFGVNTSATADYKYIANYGPGRIYSVGIDYTPFTGPATSVPVVTNLPASNIQGVTATLNGQILATGGGPPPVVTLYYGPVDGGTNAAAWAASVPWGPQNGSFSLTVTALTTNTAYFFTASASNAIGTAWAAPSPTFTTLSNSTLVSILTYHNDNTRAGANTNEFTLTPANVNAGSFGKLFTYSVDGYLYGEPLVVANVSIPGRGVHNVVYVATEHDTVYAFDADNFVSAPYWTTSFIDAAAGITTVPASESNEPNIAPESGITATPVIDPLAGTIYLEVRTKEVSGNVITYPHRLHALDITTGLERTNSPALIAATNYPGTGTGGYVDNDGHGHVLWNALRENCRPALLLANGVVYVAYASPGDNSPYHGWVFGYDARTLAQTGVFNDTPNGGLGGIWQAGNGPAADSDGYIYLITGNGTFGVSSNNFGDSYLKLAATTNGLALADYFTPYNQDALNTGDIDVGSAGLFIVPDSAGSTAHPHLLLGGSKANTIYLLDRDNLGKYNTNSDSQIVQELNNAVGGMWCSPAYFNGMFYIVGQSDSLKSFTISNGQMGVTPTAHSAISFGSSTPCISADGTNNAIVWAMEAYSSIGGGAAVLHAFNATNVAQELYNSGQNLARDNPGGAIEYTVPAIVNGKVYVGAQYALSVFGNGNFLAAPVISPNGGIYTNSVTVTITDATPGAAIYYTLDGTTPTTGSLLYAGAFTLTNTVGVQAVAAKPGAVNSGITTAGFFNSAFVGNGIGLHGDYYANQAKTFNNPPTLERIDPTINFDWNNVSPDPSIGQTDYTVRWTGSVKPQFNEAYTFYATADDGVRVWVDGRMLIDGWVDQPPTTYQGSIALNAQQLYDIQIDYYQNGGGAVAELEWSSPSTPRAVIPESQLYPVTNPPPAVAITSPASNSVYTAGGSVTVSAAAAAQYNTLASVALYTNQVLLGVLTNSPYILTTTGWAAGSYTLTAIATDGSGMTGTSAPVKITINAGTGQPYALSARARVPAFLNMPAAINGALPATLSQTGVFTNTPNMDPVGGLIPYSPNVPLWSDGALKTRWLALPFAGGLDTPDQQIGFAPTGEWTFPTGTIFVKHFAVVTDETNPNVPPRRLETRLLVRDTNGAVYGVTYKWRTDNSDADLMAGSLSEDIIITNANGTRTQTWYYPSPSDCLMCHTPAANYVLGVKTRQLNGNFAYPASGVTDNQLREFNHLGLFNPAIDEAGITNLSYLVSLTNQNASLQDRARSYIDANCAQCHRPSGPGPTFDARYDTPLTNQNIINAQLIKGDLGADNARVVAPDDIWRSILYQRADRLDPLVKMPPLARNLVDTNAMAVIAAWINSLPGTPSLPPPVIVPAGGTFNGSVSVALQAPATNALVFYTLDGSLPTTNSLFYSGAFTLTNSTLVSANAFEAGFNNSVAATGLFAILPSVFFTTPGFFTNHAFELELSGATGKSYVIQATADFVDWISLGTNTPGVSPFYFVDPGASNAPHRFYRALQQP